MRTKDISTVKLSHPQFIEPMQAAPMHELPDSGLWTYEAKLDGYAAWRQSGAAEWRSGPAEVMALQTDSQTSPSPAKTSRLRP